MTWEEAQMECSWCGSQQVAKEVNTELALCEQCLERYHTYTMIYSMKQKSLECGFYNSSIGE